MAALAAVNIDPLLIADFANSNYDGGNTPSPAAGVTGYANYAANLAQRWQAQVGTVEIWNEYNGTCCQGTAASNRPEYYTAMLSAAYRAIKAKSPATTVLGAPPCSCRCRISSNCSPRGFTRPWTAIACTLTIRPPKR